MQHTFNKLFQSSDADYSAYNESRYDQLGNRQIMFEAMCNMCEEEWALWFTCCDDAENFSELTLCFDTAFGF